MKKLLIVEDSLMVLKIIKHVFSNSRHLELHFAESFAQAKELLEREGEWFASLIDLNLPDAPNGEVVDYVLSKNIPTIVLTGSFDEERRELLLAKGIVDYVTKEGKFSYEYALGVVNRLIKNQSTHVLVVDDSQTSRQFVCNLLQRHLFTVHEAVDGVQAVKVLLGNPQIKLLITDYNMPRMDGFELVKNLRCKYEKTDLVIIGISSEGDDMLSAKFIKNGANDFLKKPFNHEEFHCRVSHSIELLELVEQIKDSASRDDLTGTYNRKYFFELAGKKYIEAKENQNVMSVCVLDLDGFKEINSRYGNDVGDLIIQHVANRFVKLFDKFVLARAGGEEFFVCMPGLNSEQACAFVEKVRQIVSAEKMDMIDDATSMTFSAGVSSKSGNNLDEQLINASLCLKRAKEAGGDLVFGDD